MSIPETSTTLLRQLASDSDHARWGEFVARYRPVLEAFMATRFPTLDADDIIQETFIAVAKALPDYRYVPGETGHFHNFLTGILHHKALNAVRGDKRRAERVREYAERQSDAPVSDDEQQRWRETVYEIALQQLMADPDIADRNKQIFTRTAIKGEKPEAVAESLAVSRNVVDQTKKRMTDRLRRIVSELVKTNES